MKEIIITIIPLVGVLIGWGCTEFSRRITNAKEKKETINRVVALLLELYFQMKGVMVIRKQVEKSISKIVNLFEKEDINFFDSKEIKTQLRNLVSPLISKMSLQDMKKLGKDYEEALSELSSYDPVTAYRLKGGCDVTSIIDTVDDYYKNILGAFQIEEEWNDIKEFVENPIYLQLEQNNVLLREDILTLSHKTERNIYQDVKKELDHIDNDNAIETQIEEILQQIEKLFNGEFLNEN